MRLCFGTFATVLNCCCQDIQQAAFVARIAKCIDPQSSYIAIESRFVQEDDWEIAGDGPAISKLLEVVFTKGKVSGRIETWKRKYGSRTQAT